MKKIALLLFGFLFTVTAFAQEPEAPQTPEASQTPEWGDLKNNKLTLNELPPIWPGCEKEKTAERNECFKDKLRTHIRKFKYPADVYLNKAKIIVTFFINNEKMPEIVEIVGGNQLQQQAAKLAILTIPKMIKPGMYAGKPKAILHDAYFNF